MPESETRDETAETAFAGLAVPLVQEALKQAEGIVNEPSAEGLHQLRVALRRMRSLWWAYRPLLDRGENTRQRALFKFLADAAGKTRDYDILIELLATRSKADVPADFAKARQRALEVSRETLSNADMKTLLHNVLAETSRALKATERRRPLHAFSDGRVAVSEKDLTRRIRRAAKARRSDYTAIHDVRKAGKRVRYLLELFGPVLSGQHQKTLKRLKRIQTLLGELNDVVASEALLRENVDLLNAVGDPEQTLAWFRKERKRRMRAAATLLRNG
ncbi:CHAD domain-containing protein [Paraburkholderia sp. BL10I2N1]|uniref:CHAD domain-containing protein n=1 Tax=Paraburkholderia sp. BL10I2N1 TaxID=1938796 RepID=UPI001FB57852|nr:CHAD domain-containing protein [Paraburkholderia sp. BL10I2N1]